MRCDRFRADHAELAVLAQELQALVNTTDPAAALAPVEACLMELMGKLNAHLIVEDNVLYPVLARCRDEAVSKLASRYLQEMQTTSARLQDYRSTWTATAINADFETFRAETNTVIDVLLDRIEREETELYTAAESLPSGLLAPPSAIAS